MQSIKMKKLSGAAFICRHLEVNCGMLLKVKDQFDCCSQSKQP